MCNNYAFFVDITLQKMVDLFFSIFRTTYFSDRNMLTINFF